MTVNNREEKDMKSILAAGTILLALVGPAFANQCPTLAAKAEAALKTASLDAATKATVTTNIAEGKALHEADKHDESVAKLNETLKLLGM
jgi:hypothetical protein